MGILRPFFWLLIGFGLAPIVNIMLAILSIGRGEMFNFPVDAIATLCLYLFAADLGWLLLGQSLPMGLAGAASAAALLGYGVPAVVNASIAAKSSEVISADAVPVDMGKPQVLALLTPYEKSRDKWQVETDCEILCQRLLYWGGRKAVLMGATPPSGIPTDATGLIRYSIERRSSCPPVKVPDASVMSGQMRYGNSYATSETVQNKIGWGECLVTAVGSIAEADVVTIKSEPNSADWMRAGSRAGPLAIWRSDVFRRTDAGWVKVGRSTTRRFSRAKLPLSLRIDGFFPRLLDSGEDRADPSDPYMIEHMLAPWLGWPEGMPGGSQGPPPLQSSDGSSRN